ncbi:MAG TPA: deoxyguanosinetriphosphate triphosphohydrolase [Polyangia bacterium]|nr:deoxyguanosinetriphosphate triphosphohydrolase [Polyangia bacterium]
MSSIREHLESRERQLLSRYARLSAETEGRARPEPEDDLRTAFQRDRDRILHAKSFRRLAHKTQVFLAPEGDHYRTRITHTFEVTQVARTMARALGLNEDLTEAMAMGHDLGHTPFGHAGEFVLARLVPGGFHHARQSVRVVEQLEREGGGLNLTREVREGILKHSKGRGPIFTEGPHLAATLEGQIVRVADIIAYANHDLDDALRARLVAPDDIPVAIRETLGETHGERLRTLILAVIAASPGGLPAESGASQGDEGRRGPGPEVGEAGARPRIRMQEEVLAALVALRDFLYQRVYEARVVREEFEKAQRILEELWGHFHQHPDEFRARYWLRGTREEEGLDRAVTDFIAGMTDRYALRLYEELRLPRRWSIY